MRTSKSVVFLRSCFVIFCVFLPFSWLWNTATETNFWQPWEMAISAVLIVVFLGSVTWLVTNFGMGLLFGKKPEYRAYRNSGGAPFFVPFRETGIPSIAAQGVFSPGVWQAIFDDRIYPLWHPKGNTVAPLGTAKCLYKPCKLR